MFQGFVSGNEESVFDGVSFKGFEEVKNDDFVAFQGFESNNVVESTNNVNEFAIKDSSTFQHSTPSNLTADELFEKSASAFSLEFSKVMESKRSQSSAIEELPKPRKVEEKKIEDNKQNLPVITPIIPVNNAQTNLLSMQNLFKLTKDESLDVVFKRLVSSFRFDEASILKNHMKHESEFKALKSKYEDAKAKDDLDLAVELKKKIQETEKLVLSEDRLKEIRRVSNEEAWSFPLKEITLDLISRDPKIGSDYAKKYSVSVFLDAAERDPTKAIELLREAENEYANLCEVKPSTSVVLAWQRIVSEVEKEISLFIAAFENASNNSSKTLKDFSQHTKVVNHFKALNRMYHVGNRCNLALSKCGVPSLKLDEKWEHLLSLSNNSTTIQREKQNESYGKEPKCSVCWCYINPNDKCVSMIATKDIPCHLYCANLYLNRIDQTGSIEM